MNEHAVTEEIFEILRVLSSSDNLTQRDLSAQMGISLGKTNYLLKALIKRGFIAVKNFSRDGNKLNKVHYILTEKGFNQRLQLTHHFLQRKEAEYIRMKKEWELLQAQNNLSAIPGETAQSPSTPRD